MTQMIQPSDNALTANLSKLAGFIEQRAQQKKQIGQITKNSLSKSEKFSSSKCNLKHFIYSIGISFETI